MKVLAKKELPFIRIKNGHSQTSLAEKIKVTRQHLSQIESGKNGIDPQKAYLVCKILKSEFDELFEIQERT